MQKEAGLVARYIQFMLSNEQKSAKAKKDAARQRLLMQKQASARLLRKLIPFPMNKAEAAVAALTMPSPVPGATPGALYSMRLAKAVNNLRKGAADTKFTGVHKETGKKFTARASDIEDDIGFENMKGGMSKALDRLRGRFKKTTA